MTQQHHDISICMPYFERMLQLNRTLESFGQCGYFPDIEVSICDDGSVLEPAEDSLFREHFILTKLPPKDDWKCPTLSLNVAVCNSTAPLIVLQSPETYHPTPILHQMAALMQSENDVIMAAVQHEGEEHVRGGWCAHPKHKPNILWWCQLMTRHLFNRIGGMNDDFRDLYAGEDNDLAIRLLKAGARFRWLPVERGYAVNYRTAKINVENKGDRHTASKLLLLERHGKHALGKLVRFKEG